MAKGLQKVAPLLVMAGVALMPKRKPHLWAPLRKPAPPEHPALRETPAVNRSTTDPADLGDASRGRLADAPQEIPKKGWRDILIRSWKEFQEDQIPLVAAGVTFYVLLSVFPALGAFVALYGLFADAADAHRHLQLLSFLAPADVLTFLGAQMQRIATAREGGLSLAFVGGLLLSVWSANGAMKAIIIAMNIAYDETEKRGFLRKTLVSLAFTLGFLTFAIGMLVLAAAASAVEPFAGAFVSGVLKALTWVGMLLGMGAGLALLYRYGPSRERARWRWISGGSAAALALWIAASAAFSVYISNFAHYDRAYGSLGAVIGLMMWVYVSAQVILLGAELNSEIEHQTARDTTTGAPLPMGERGAAMADTVGAAQ